MSVRAPLLSARIGLLVAAALLGSPMTAPAADAIVVAEAAVVHADLFPESPRVGVLTRGDVVQVEFCVDGTWCRVALPQPGGAGYVRADQIERPPAPHGPTERGPAAPGSYPAPRGRPEGWPPAALAQSLPLQIALNKYNAAFWARQLEFSDQQMVQLRHLAGQTGVTECRRRIAEWYRQHGPDRSVEAFKRAMRELPTLAGVRCDVARFWSAFPAIMTPEQRREFQSWQRQQDIPYLTRAPLDPTLEWFE